MKGIIKLIAGLAVTVTLAGSSTERLDGPPEPSKPSHLCTRAVHVGRSVAVWVAPCS
jgi:hypothetical protein